MSNVRLATGGSWNVANDKAWRPRGGRRRLRFVAVGVLVGIIVAAVALTRPKPKRPKRHRPAQTDAAPPDGLRAAVAALARGADARATFSMLLSEEDRAHLALTETDARGRAKNRMSAADRALVFALLSRSGGSFHPEKVRGVRASRAVVRKNCLVFGLPGDARAWTAAGHRLVFLDHRAARRGTHILLDCVDEDLTPHAGEDAVRAARDEGVNAYVARYASAPKSAWEASPYTHEAAKLVIDSPSYDVRGLVEIFWDLIVVDGPDSVQQSSTGRAAPVARAASILQRQALSHPDRRVDVLVHDAHRSHELELGLAYLSPLAAFANYRSLRASRMPNSTSEVRFAWFARDPP